MRPLTAWPSSCIGRSLAATPRQQPQEPLTDIAIHRVELARRVACTEVVAPAAKDGVEFRDHVADVLEALPTSSTGQVMELGSDGLHGPPRWRPEQIVAFPDVRT